MTSPGWCFPPVRAAPGGCGDKLGEAGALSSLGGDRRTLHSLEHDVQLVNPPHHIARESLTEGGMSIEQPLNGPGPQAIGPSPGLPAAFAEVLEADVDPSEPCRGVVGVLVFPEVAK